MTIRRITLQDLTTATGCGPRTARRLVREGKLPGFVDGTRYVCSPGEFDEWVRGDWTPRNIPSTSPKSKPEKPSFLRTVDSSAA